VDYALFVVQRYKKRMDEAPLLIACSDLHLSMQPPAFRSAEPDWLAAQARPLRWLKKLAKQYGCPVVIAGDIFDRAVSDSRLLNFADRVLPCAYAVAGNHDLPYHNVKNISESAYGMLMRTKRIVDIDGVVILNVNGVSVALHGFYFDKELASCEKRADVDILVAHRFVWAHGSCYGGASNEYHLDRIADLLTGYDFCVFGDNHIPFLQGNVVNCGSFYRREKGHVTFQPVVVFVFKDRLEFVPVPVADDIISVRGDTKAEKDSPDFTRFFQSLSYSESLVCDVDELLRAFLVSRDISSEVRDAITTIVSA